MDSIHVLDIQTLLLLWQRGLRVLWQQPSQRDRDLVLSPFQRHVEVLASENTENGSWETMRTGERETVQ